MSLEEGVAAGFTELAAAVKALRLDVEAGVGGGTNPGSLDAFSAKLDMRSGDAIVALLGDSTGDADAEWFRSMFAALCADHPLIRGEYVPWNENTGLNPWPDPATGSYGATQVVQTAEAAEELIASDTFTRTVTDMYGSTPDIGPAWAGAASAPGDWSLNGSSAVATSDATRGHNILDGGATGDQRVAVSGVTLSTVSGGGNRNFFVYAKYLDSANHVIAEVRTVSASGAANLFLAKRIGNTTTTLVPNVSLGLTANQASQSLASLELRVQGLTVSVYLNGSGTPLTTASLDASDVTALATATSAGFHATNQTGMTVDRFDLHVLQNITATTVTAYNGSAGGSSFAYHLARMERLLPVAPDLVILSSSHNYAATTGDEYLDIVDDVVAAIHALYPDAGILLSSQNPRYGPAQNKTAHAQRLAALRAHAERHRYGYLPVFERFLTSGGSTLVEADGVHPTTGAGSGSEVWADVAHDWFTARSYVV